MTGATMCSGIGAPETAAPWIDWQWCAEVEPFPSAVLAHHRPDVPNLGDVTAADFIQRAVAYGPLDLFVAGTPCQGFSVAGLRGSLSDDRSNIMFRFVETANAINPRVVIWENVPGVLNTPDNAFGCLLGALAGHDAPLVPGRGQRWTDAGMVDGPKRRVAWRILDAQYFGVAQRRERVFVVACPRNGADPAEVLFEREGLQRDSPPSREAGQRTSPTLEGRSGRSGANNFATSGGLIAPADIAPTIPSRTNGGGGLGTDFDCDGGLVAYGGGNCSGPIEVGTALTHHGCRQDFDTETFVCAEVAPTICGSGNRTGGDRPYGTQVETADSLVITHALGADGFDVSEDGTGRGTPLVPVTVPTLTGNGDAHSGFKDERGLVPSRFYISCGDIADSLTVGANQTTGFKSDICSVGMAVRRLTPRECERLQGFPDDSTDVTFRRKPAADGPRYKALGNSMCVSVMRWIIERAGGAA